LEAKRTYYMQRSIIRWVKFGDENTKLKNSGEIISLNCSWRMVP
jgi:hypothetical protein